MANNKIETTLEAVNSGQKSVILTGKSPIYEYKDGKKVSEIPIAHKFNVALFNRLTPLAVKIEGSNDPLNKVSDEMIDSAIRGDNGADFIMAQFADCKVALFSIGGQLVMSATATSIELVTAGK